MARSGAPVLPCLARIAATALLGLSALSCKQPFEPNGPAGSTLILYCILNGQGDTQYVRLTTTYRDGSNPEVHGATVLLRPLTQAGPVVRFRDTTIDRVNTLGEVEHLPIYVANHFHPGEGVTYTLTAEVGGTGTDRLAGATTVSLFAPTIGIESVGTLEFKGDRPIVLKAGFVSVAGAAEAHFYIEYYHLVNEGWVLGREEVAKRSYTDPSGNLVLIYHSLTPVTELTVSPGNPARITFDGAEYAAALKRVAKLYGAENVAFIQAAFSLTQVDNVLYNYYFLNNGPVDQSSVRLDVPEYTNIRGGLGVFGSSVIVKKVYSIRPPAPSE